MPVNREFTLAVHSLLFLDAKPERYARSAEIASSAQAHPVQVRKVLSVLRDCGYVESKEGIGGGFSLKGDSSRINLWDIYQVTAEGTLRPKGAEEKVSYSLHSSTNTLLSIIFTDAEEHLGDFLKDYTIADLSDLWDKSR